MRERDLETGNNGERHRKEDRQSRRRERAPQRGRYNQKQGDRKRVRNGIERKGKKKM